MSSITLVSLRKQAKDLELKGYSKLKKPELEKMIDAELWRRENAELERIRQSDSSYVPASQTSSLALSEPIDLAELESIPITVVKGKGISNDARVRNYCHQTPGRNRLTVAQARRIRRNAVRGDMTVPISLHFAGIKVSTAMGV